MIWIVKIDDEINCNKIVLNNFVWIWCGGILLFMLYIVFELCLKLYIGFFLFKIGIIDCYLGLNILVGD